MMGGNIRRAKPNLTKSMFSETLEIFNFLEIREVI